MSSAAEDRYRAALEAVTAELEALPWVVGILFFGSVQRGEAGPHSDLDAYVVTDGDQYWRATRYYRGVETELFFNPVDKMRERIAGRTDVTAIHGFATGEVLLDRTGVMAELVQLAREILAAGPPAATEEEVLRWRYRLTSLKRDLEDVSHDPVASRYVAGIIAQYALQAYCVFNRLWGVKAKHMPAFIAGKDRTLGRLVAELLADPDPGVGRLLVDHVLAPVGGRLGAFEGPKRRLAEGQGS